jgi:hypothetical protein
VNLKALGDGCVITPGLIKGDNYSYLIETKTVLWIQEPADDVAQRGLPLFFLGASLSAAAGVWMDGTGYVLLLPLLFVAALAAWSLMRRFLKAKADGEWKLFIGSSEDPKLIYSTSDAAAFEAKRDEIERVLVGHHVSEEK